ncbi:hypothetical protein [Amycolatopsis sp. NBC_00345]|uniref:hypothetical protein n=1 Tax=Amycolatopsis sp. NBC_00345 TaxID=2975955 RepID=UPI003FA418E1
MNEDEYCPGQGGGVAWVHPEPVEDTPGFDRGEAAFHRASGPGEHLHSKINQPLIMARHHQHQHRLSPRTGFTPPGPHSFTAVADQTRDHGHGLRGHRQDSLVDKAVEAPGGWLTHIHDPAGGFTAEQGTNRQHSGHPNIDMPTTPTTSPLTSNNRMKKPQ